MDIKATIASSYRNRLILIALGAMLYSAWCFYDGYFVYPDKQDAFKSYQTLQVKFPDDQAKVNEQWEEVAAGNGWDGTLAPEEVTDWSIRTQWIQFGIVFPIGAYCLFSLVRWSRRYIGCDATKLYGSGGTEFGFDQVTRVEASRWDTKGIASIYYDAGQGERSLLIDDWKYDREPTDRIFDRLREQVDADKFEGLTKGDASAAENDAAAPLA